MPQVRNDQSERAVQLLCDGVARFEEAFLAAIAQRLPPAARDTFLAQMACAEADQDPEDFIVVARRTACRGLIMEGAYVGSAEDLFRNFVRACAAEIARAVGDDSHVVVFSRPAPADMARPRPAFQAKSTFGAV